MIYANITTAKAPRRRLLTRPVKILIGVLLAPFISAMLVGTVLGIDHAMHPTSTVSDFNDGFATSKQDDCQQGFQPACEWLKNNR